MSRPDQPQTSLIRELFSIDLRSLALLRIGLGLVLIGDLVDRARSLTMHYSNAGVMPGEVLADRIHPALNAISIYTWIDHSPTLIAAMFAAHGVVALLLVLGWRTRWVTAACWYLLVSLQARNPELLNAGDRLLVLLLFWSLFLPLGARWALDRSASNRAPEDDPADNAVCSIATFAIMMQVVFVYVFTVLNRITPLTVRGVGDLEWWRGQAVWFALNIDLYTTRLGLWLREQRSMLPILNYMTLALEFFGPLLMFFPVAIGPLRCLLILAFIGMHLGFGLCMTLGTFPWIDAVAWMVFVPSWFWDRLLPRLGGVVAASRIRDMMLPARASIGSGIRRLPHVLRPKLGVTRLPLFAQVGVALLLVYVTLYNIAGLAWPQTDALMPQIARLPGKALRIDQSWTMFSPAPTKYDGWFVLEATLADGRTVDPRFNAAPVWEKPPFLAGLHAHYRERIRLMNSVPESAWTNLRHYAAYWTQRWNDQHAPEQHITRMNVHVYREVTEPTFVHPPFRSLVAQYDPERDVCVFSFWQDDEFIIPPPPWEETVGGNN